MRTDFSTSRLGLAVCAIVVAATGSACSSAGHPAGQDGTGTTAAATKETTMDVQAGPSIEAASKELETAIQEIRDSISQEFPDAQWRAPENTEQGFSGSVCDDPDTMAAYTAQLWQLPVKPTEKQMSDLTQRFVEIAARYGYTTTEQNRPMGEASFLDLAGPYPGSTIGLAHKKALVLTGSLGCMPRETTGHRR